MLNPVVRDLVKAQLVKCNEALAQEIGWRNQSAAALAHSEERIAQLEFNQRALAESLEEPVLSVGAGQGGH